MPSVIQYYEGIGSVAVIGNYVPRQCGIATFTTDLTQAISAEAPDINCWAVAMNDQPEGYAYPCMYWSNPLTANIAHFSTLMLRA